MTGVLAIYFSPADTPPGGCEIYRINMPLHYLGEHGWDTGWVHFETLMADYRARKGAALAALFARYQIVVLPRMVAPSGQHLAAARTLIDLLHAGGVRVVYEVDDDLSNRYRDLSPKGVDNAMTIARWCDAITVTTPYLAELMQRETKRPVYVLPNMLDASVWDQPARAVSHPELVIGLSGSATHEADWRVLESVLPKILNSQYDMPVRLKLTAYHPPYLQNLPQTDYLPAADYLRYAEIVRQCDVVLAPIDPRDGFNRSKSPIKVLEGMAASRPVGQHIGGAAVIATRSPVYQLAIQHEKTGLLVRHTPDDWYAALDRVIRDSAVRQSFQRRGHSWVYRHHAIHRKWTLWRDAYRAILA